MGVDLAAVAHDVVEELVELVVGKSEIAADLWQIADVFAAAVAHPVEGVVDEIEIKLARLVKIFPLVLEHELFAVGDGLAAAQMQVEIGDALEHVSLARCGDVKFETEILLVRIEIQLGNECHELGR